MPRRERSRSARRGAGGGSGNATKKTRLGKTQTRTLETKGKGKGGGKGHASYASTLKGGKKVCLAYNFGNCMDGRCPHNGLHKCNVIENGRVCGGNHPSKNHNFGTTR